MSLVDNVEQSRQGKREATYALWNAGWLINSNLTGRPVFFCQTVARSDVQPPAATSSISAHIFNMQRAAGESVGAIKAIGLTIERISGITTSISSAVEQQGTATQSIAEGVLAASSGTLDVADNVERVAKNAAKLERRQV
jgi:hypothetical protein